MPALSSGADAGGRVMLYSPSSYAGGSSVSHWDTSADPDLLMEPALTSMVSSDVDLTRWSFVDMGWFNGATAGAGDAGTQTGLALAPAAPNPSHGGPMRIEYALPREAHVRLSVLDVRGREVAALDDRICQPGSYQATWSGQDDRGPVPVGLYFVRYQGRGVHAVRRVVVAR